jgi:hypothetical protein
MTTRNVGTTPPKAASNLWAVEVVTMSSVLINLICAVILYQGGGSDPVDGATKIIALISGIIFLATVLVLFVRSLLGVGGRGRGGGGGGGTVGSGGSGNPAPHSIPPLDTVKIVSDALSYSDSETSELETRFARIEGKYGDN